MTTNAKRWIVCEHDSHQSNALARSLGVSEIVARLLIARGITDERSARRFLHPSHDQLHDPLLMLDMRRAVERLLRAIERGERILVYGDYDVDGTTGTVVLRRALHLLGARTGYHVPHRFTEGYGIQQAALEKAVADGYRLVVSVDCGIRAHEPLLWARGAGLDVIVTDHHLPDKDEGAPPAYAVLNPNQRGCPYPDKNLAGVGVAFKLAHALLRERGLEHKIGGFLKMVAIGTVADVARLVGENRTIVALGLADLPKATNPGLRALMEVAGLADRRDMTAYDLGFRIGPRINAAGRMEAARSIIELFETTEMEEARRLADHLDTLNRERQTVQSEITRHALAALAVELDSAHAHVAVVAGDGWHRGVIGIAASKVAERINRPCIVISLEDDMGHGSARSIEAYHLLNGLTACADLFEKFGGHSHAAGLTIRRDRIPELRRRLNEHAALHLGDQDLLPVLHIDAELPPSALSLALTAELKRLEPYGAGNPRPVFMTRDMRLLAEPRVLKERHLKMSVASSADGRAHDAIWWNGVEETRGRTPRAHDRIEMAYTVEPNTWQGVTRLQLCVQDMRKQ